MASSPEAKEMHRKSMVLMGLVTVACGLAAAYLAFGPAGDLPSLMYGRLSKSAGAARADVRTPGKVRVGFREWGRDVLVEARKKDRLILLHLQTVWSVPSRLMEEGTYGDVAVAEWISKTVIPVSLDADLRPDLAARYLSGGWPTTALLLPTGEILASGTYMTPKAFLDWAGTVTTGFSIHRDRVREKRQRVWKERWSQDTPSSRSPDLAAGSEQARKQVLAMWDEEVGFGQGPRFARFKTIEALRRIGAPWADTIAAEASALATGLEDPVWGGFFRSARNEDWTDIAYEKLLEDQAYALMARLGYGIDKKTLGYVNTHLLIPGGGYASSQASEVALKDGSYMQGHAFFSLFEKDRSAIDSIPKTDRRIFTRENALMARAVLGVEGIEDETMRRHALVTLEFLWTQAVSGGEVSRSPGSGIGGLLGEQLELARAFLAGYENTDSPEYLSRAEVLVLWAETNLKDPRSAALFDRRGAGEFPKGADRVLVPSENLLAASLFRRLAGQLPPGETASRLARRSDEIASWLSVRTRSLDPALWATFLRETSRSKP